MSTERTLIAKVLLCSSLEAFAQDMQSFQKLRSDLMRDHWRLDSINFWGTAIMLLIVSAECLAKDLEQNMSGGIDMRTQIFQRTVTVRFLQTDHLADSDSDVDRRFLVADLEEKSSSK